MEMCGFKKLVTTFFFDNGLLMIGSLKERNVLLI